MGKIILLIDDDEDEFELFIEALHEAHFTGECIFAKTAEQAIGLLCHTVPDFIFLDYNMPKINGLKCLMNIKQISSLKDVPVILYSTGMTEELSRIAISLGAVLCIRKPDKFHSMTEILQQVIMSVEQLKWLSSSTIISKVCFNNQFNDTLKTRRSK